MRIALLTVLAVALGLAVAPPPGAPPTRTLDDCDAAARDHPKDLPSYLCYWLVARRQKAWPDAARRLDERLALEPDNHLAQLYLGLIELDQRHDRGKDLLVSAADGLEKEKNWTGAVYANISLEIYNQIRRDLPAAEPYLVRAERAAQASGDPMLLARIDYERARQAYLVADYSRAWTLIEKASNEVTAEAPFDLRSGVLGHRGAVLWQLGRYRDSLDAYERQADLLHSGGDLYTEAQARYNVAVLSRGQDGISRDQSRAAVRRAYDIAVATGNLGMLVDVRLLMAEDAALPVADRVALVETALKDAQVQRHTCAALRMLAPLKLESDPSHPEAAMALVDRAIEDARVEGTADEVALSLVAKMNLRWRIGPREAAIADGLAALDALEKVRDLQRDELVRARWFNRQAVYYYEASGRILESSKGAPSPVDLDLAFSIGERMRARALLDALDAATVTGGRKLDDPRAAERDKKLLALADAQRRLIAEPKSQEEKAGILAEIASLERDEALLRDEIARDHPTLAALARPKVPTIAEVQSYLAPDQALLAFQLSTKRVDDVYSYSNGGSWVFAITRDGARAFPLDDFDLLARRIDVWIGTFERRDGLERASAGALYDALLAAPLASLPSTIRRLVIVPDRELHRLPFDALRTTESDAPLGTRYEISIAPSATVWARWRRAHEEDAPAAALAFADPELPSAAAPSALRQSAPWVDGLRLGSLPHARTEARQLSRLLGERCRLLEGSSASEHRLKRMDPKGFGMLVLATHAVIDEDRPERSAVILSPGAADEDGLLQVREIAGLPLAGRVVVLTSCSSASGELLRGEGVVGLTRAFFEAGARTVVASLWPMRDDEAAALAGDFYARLSRGGTVGAALAEARRETIRGGAPAAAWAGLVVLGDADAVPFPGGVPAHPSWPRIAAVALVLIAAAAIAALVMQALRIGKL